MDNHTAFAKASNGLTQIEHSMYGRRASWSPLWWWPCFCYCCRALMTLSVETVDSDQLGRNEFTQWTAQLSSSFFIILFFNAHFQPLAYLPFVNVISHDSIDIFSHFLKLFFTANYKKYKHFHLVWENCCCMNWCWICELKHNLVWFKWFEWRASNTMLPAARVLCVRIPNSTLLIKEMWNSNACSYFALEHKFSPQVQQEKKPPKVILLRKIFLVHFSHSFEQNGGFFQFPKFSYLKEKYVFFLFQRLIKYNFIKFMPQMRNNNFRPLIL